MRIASEVIVVVALLCVSQMGVAAEKKTVYAVAKVDGRTKRIDGKVYHLVAMKLDPSVFLLNTGLGSSVLLINGSHGKAALEDGDRSVNCRTGDTASTCCGCISLTRARSRCFGAGFPTRR